MRYVKGLLLGVCLVLMACGIVSDRFGEAQKSLPCSMCSITGPYLTIHLTPPVSENVVLELKRTNQKNIEVKCELFPSNPFIYTPLNYREPYGGCNGEYIDKKDDQSSEIKYELVNINKVLISFASAFSDKPFDFANEANVEVSLTTQCS